MTVSVATFRSDYPEFGDTVAFSDSGVIYWLGIAGLLLNTAKWGIGSAAASSPPSTLYDFGTELFVAHNLTLEARAQAEAAVGAAPGVTTGPVSAKSVDKVSTNYDTASGLNPADTHWNLTVFGTRFIQLAKVRGITAIYVGGGCAPGPLNGPAWPGPYPWPAPSGTGFG
jgi:hypothetical protein